MVIPASSPETAPVDSATKFISSTPETSPGTPPGTSPRILLEASSFSNNQDKHQSMAKWQVFSSTFLTIFLAEMGDKTQIATLLMTAQSHNPWVIFWGAATALIATSLIGVLLGRWLASRLSPKTLDRSAAIMLLAVAAMLSWEVFQG